MNAQACLYLGRSVCSFGGSSFFSFDFNNDVDFSFFHGPHVDFVTTPCCFQAPRIFFSFFFFSFYWTQTCPSMRGAFPYPPPQRPDQHTGNSMPYSLRLMCGFFNVPQGYEDSSVVRRDLRFIVLIRED